MRLLSVNTGRGRPVRNGRKVQRSGIYKMPVEGEVGIFRLGLEGDEICETENHGGPDQAVYLYGAPDYDWWTGELGRELPPGTFGENLTVFGLESGRVNVGDRFVIGEEVVLEATAPRIPCAKLAAKLEDPLFVKRFRHAERPGVYCRVVREGSVRAGEEVLLEPRRGETLSLVRMFRDFYEPRPSEETLRRHLAAPIAVRDRRARRKQLEELLERRATDDTPGRVK